jgi:hypothetical protein
MGRDGRSDAPAARENGPEPAEDGFTMSARGRQLALWS